MKTLEEIKKILIEHRSLLQTKFNVKRLALFGSYARHENTPKSDIDILVELSKPAGWEIVDLHEYLKEILDMKVDLVTKNAVVRKEILWKSIQKDLVNV